MADKVTTDKPNPPTEKMVGAAKQAAERHGVALPKGYDKDFDKCKAFLNAYLVKPTPKAMSFAQKIADIKGIEIPAEAQASSRELSAWIDANK